MFEIKEKPVKLINVNPRPELHGDDTKLAADIKLQAQCANSVLDYFDRGLREMLYKRDESPDLVDRLDADALTALRFPKLGALKWDWEGVGYRLVVDWGLGGDSNIVLGDCKVDKVSLEAQPGGTVVVTFRVIAHPDAEDLGPLCELMQRDITIDLVPPAPTTVHELFGEQKAA